MQSIRKTHPNIVTLNAVLHTSNNLYIFMEFCDQGDLKQFIKRRSASNFLPEEEARHILLDVVKGLSHLSKVCKIMHRDIKLDNVLVKRKVLNDDDCHLSMDQDSTLPLHEYEFKLGDLGLAKNVMDESELQATQCGTPLYMAPEVINGYLYDLKADVWSLGTLLF